MEEIVNLFVGFLQVLYLWILGSLKVFIPKSLRLKSVEGKNVLITGGGSGIGRLMAMKLYERGANIVIWDINPEGLKSTVEDLHSIRKDGKVLPMVVDVSDRNEVYEKSSEVKKQLGPESKVDILINNAGIVNGKRFLKLEDEKVVKLFEVNTLAHIWITKAFLPEMLADNDGHLVYIASIAGLSGGCNISDYAASKFANLGLEESIRYELKADGYNGIRSSIVCPWFISTGLFAGAKSDIIPFLEPEYVADCIIEGVLANDETIFIPRMMYLLYFLKSFLPSSASYKLFEVLKGTTAMDSFTGRHGSSDGSPDNERKTRALWHALISDLSSLN